MAITAIDLSGVAQRLPSASVEKGGIGVATVLQASLALVVVGNLGRVPILDGGTKEAPLLFNDLLVGAILAVVILAAVRLRSLRVDNVGVLALLFAAVGAFSAMLAVPRFGLTGFQFFFSIAYLIRWVVYFAVYLATINFATRRDVEGLWNVLERAILVFAIFGIFQSLFLPGFAQIVQPNAAWDQQGRRLVSSFLDPNFAGGLIMIGFLVLLARLSYGVAVPRWKIGVLFAALLMTLSRSSLLAAFVGGLVLLAIRGASRRVLSVTAGLLALTLPFLPIFLIFSSTFDRFSLGGSAAQRLIAWLQAFEVIADHPIIGIGFNTYGYVQEFYNHADAFGGFHYFSLDGGLLFIMVMTGTLGVLVYVAMLAAVVMRCRRIIRNTSRTAEERGLALGIIIATVAMVIHSVFVNSLLFTLLMHPLWFLWGAAYVLEEPSIGTQKARRLKYSRSPGVTALTLIPND